MCTIMIEALTPLDRTLGVKLYENIAQSRLFYRIAKRSIDELFSFRELACNVVTREVSNFLLFG